ncbi:MAG: hypothetical protein PF508_17460, partial [Spirochaeta sp.]|nr:hypothetical protein [Spirochaeta sp.]
GGAADSGGVSGPGAAAAGKEAAATLYISGAEGLFRAAIPAGRHGRWQFEQLTTTEISELGFVDLDGDGTEELVTIEPFHGDRLVAYRVAGTETGTGTGAGPGDRRGALEPLWTHRIAFGHGLWVGPIAGVPSVIVGNRRGHGNLELLRMRGGDRPEVITLAENTGTAQVAVVHDGPVDHVVATNQNSGEVVRYTVRGD